ncbi:MAG: citramalate synthase [Clostridia bacterium]|nr:citramalate synthase [Clostridia bacterium]
MKKIEILDTTLRDGAQSEGIAYSVQDKLKIAKILDGFCIDIIEAGFPGSNPKDEELFEQLKSVKLKHAKLAAFSSTVHAGEDPENSAAMKKLLAAETPVVVIFGKASSEQVREVLKISEEENLRMIKDTVSYLKGKGKQIIFDCEHFYSGAMTDKEYTYKVLDCASEAGADTLCLCDTTGAVLPSDAEKLTEEAVSKYKRVAVHFHDDIGCAAANSLLAAEAGASQIQGTFLGIGERCGNADLSVIIPSLKFKLGYEFDCDMRFLKKTANAISEISNTRIRNNKPYIGKSAFYHKAGMHIDAVKKYPPSFEHIDPALVGNERKFVLSEISGRNTLLDRVRQLVPDADKDSEELLRAVAVLKEKELFGYHYEAAEASFSLLLRKALYKYEPHFNILLHKTTDDFPSANGELTSCSVVQIEVGGKTEMGSSLGNGPVNALDNALNRALSVFYPEVRDMKLLDFKVRVIDATTTTAAKVRVLMESTDGNDVWTTVGVSFDIIEACLQALQDSYEYKLLNSSQKHLKN